MSKRRVDALQSAMYTTKDIDDHVGLILKQIKKSRQDPEVRQLALKIASGSYDWRTDPRSGKDVPTIRAWGRDFRAPEGDVCRPRDSECEIERIWTYVVLNVRYCYDPSDIDTFATARYTLEAGSGDCDDMSILFAALLQSLGFHVALRVISTKKNPQEWIHIFVLVAPDKDNPKVWVPLDATVKGAQPGWQYEDIADTRDYVVE